MRFVIVTGMSGAGKSSALKMLEDADYFCVDNLPIPLVDKFAQLTLEGGSGEISKVAVGLDVRSGNAFEQLEGVLDNLREAGISHEILFLDAQDQVLVKRYKETRRNHPLDRTGRVDAGIARERKKLEFLKRRADYIIDTSQLLSRELKQEIDKIFVQNCGFKSLIVTILSFGFKYGIPGDADLVFDVRFLPNPYYLEELRPYTGNDEPVRSFVMNCRQAGEFLDKVEDLVRFLIPNYIVEGKNQLVIGIGCTGGKHRSVTLANGLFQRLAQMEDIGVRVEHRDIDKDASRGK
ncbi:MAG TPA: RNase adapter RapZ [Candidatus Egerieimonas intestinavium]|uniref:RNase adapter RapZ n=1 Tax=Candidatus Egerieimonas intestinavium TaxID=2840777 RepID=A0A9D1EIT4_9FIRM|nr:RNase adapter RapZ [Candidatus Egerieimonas intestinavium]